MANAHGALLRFAGALILLATASAAAQNMPGAADPLARLDRHFARWDRAELELLARESPDSEVGTLAAGAAALLAGHGEEAMAAAAAARLSQDPEIAARADHLATTAAAWNAALSELVEVTDKQGVTLRVPPSHEAWAVRVLPLIGGWVVRYRDLLAPGSDAVAEVVFLASGAQLARVTAVPEAARERTGTVAMTLLNRIFIVSPADFPDGYPWHLVVCHELVHLFVHRVAPKALPPAFEEGLAMLYEEYGHYDRLRVVTGMERALLHLAQEKGLLLDQSRLSQPFWQLDDELTVKVAFLQALAQAALVVARLPAPGVAPLLASLGAGAEWPDLLKQMADLTPNSLAVQAQGKQGSLASKEYLPSLLMGDGRRYLPATRQPLLEQGRSAVLVGDLLWGRGHTAAARGVYLRAAPELQATPDLTWRLALIELELGLVEEASARVAAGLERYPRSSRVLLAAVRTRLRQGLQEEAAALAREAWLVNPFANETAEMVGEKRATAVTPAGQREP